MVSRKNETMLIMRKLRASDKKKPPGFFPQNTEKAMRKPITLQKKVLS